MFRYLVLGLLRGGRALHGYALMKAHGERSGLRLSTGSFYRELGRLMAEGLVRATATPEGEDPRRTPYSITPAGATTFDQWFRGRPGERHDTDDELAARSLFFPEADPLVARQMLNHWSESLWLRSKVLERERKAALAEVASGGKTGFSTRALLISRRLAHVAADIEFLERLTTAYESWLAANAAPAVRTPATERKQKGASRR